MVEFFGQSLATRLKREGRQADVVLGNNVFAHAPEINDFVAGLRTLLKPGGRVILEFPYAVDFLENTEFDTIYHEHFSYFSFGVAERIFAAHGLLVYDLDELESHGGSLRLFVRHAQDHSRPITERVDAMRKREEELGFGRLDAYLGFEARARQTKWKLVEFLIQVRRQGKSVAGYGAPGKGNTLLNYCGIRTDLIDYTVDRNPFKLTLLMPAATETRRGEMNPYNSYSANSVELGGNTNLKNNLLVDGSPIGIGYKVAWVPNADAVQELDGSRVRTPDPLAEPERFAGARPPLRRGARERPPFGADASAHATIPRASRSPTCRRVRRSCTSSARSGMLRWLPLPKVMLALGLTVPATVVPPGQGETARSLSASRSATPSRWRRRR